VNQAAEQAAELQEYCLEVFAVPGAGMK